MMRRIPHKGAGYGVLKYISKLWEETESDSPEIVLTIWDSLTVKSVPAALVFLP
ncbi:hypothetical protein QNN00_16165 [Bacillus velezensis]|nr:hypothetical protein [Bacillus velezensis]